MNYLKDNDTTLLFQKKRYPAINKADNKIQLHFSTGASVTSYGNSTIFNKWIAPGFTYQVNPKINLHFGSLIVNGNENFSMYSNEQSNRVSNNLTRNFLYLSGDYKISNSIRLRATTFNEVGNKNAIQNNYYYNQMGIDIKVTDNFYISADFINEKGRRPFGIYNSNMFFDANDYLGNSFFSNTLQNTFR
ncbi:MAG: hypothetical protein ACOYO1_01145 [Bacteroidales bacterium]